MCISKARNPLRPYIRYLNQCTLKSQPKYSLHAFHWTFRRPSLLIPAEVTRPVHLWVSNIFFHHSLQIGSRTIPDSKITRNHGSFPGNKPSKGGSRELIFIWKPRFRICEMVLRTLYTFIACAAFALLVYSSGISGHVSRWCNIWMILDRKKGFE
jgi:hypothetical protein